MPVTPGTLGNPYPTINAVMNVARARVNDMTIDSDGDLLANDAPYAQTYLSAAWVWLQDQCAANGVETFIKEVLLSGLPLRGSQDVANQSYVSWLGCSDGVGQYESPVLPQDMISPLSIWRRQTGSQVFLTDPMRQAEDGLPRWFDCHVYDWRDDGLYFYADNFAQDLLVRYAAYRADLDLTLPDNLVPLMRCMNALGARVAFEFANARGGTGAQALSELADREFQSGVLSRTSRRKQRQNLRRRPFRRGCTGPGNFPYLTNT